MPDFTHEDRYEGAVCGIDEVGRGPWAGPVLAACVHIPLAVRDSLSEVKDSKVLRPALREQLASIIIAHCPHGIGQASVAEIDAHNIRRATHLAMQRAFAAMQKRYDVTASMALIDGREDPALPCPILSIIKGDTISMSIAAAAIIAKVARDRIMSDLHRDYPDYGWQQNAGYGVPCHAHALQRLGPTPHHRQTFAPVRRVIASK